MKTKLQLSSIEYPITMIRSTLIAMLMVLFTGMVYGQGTVVDVIVNSEDHNTLEAAVIAAELADDLSGEGPFTVFAPTDAAFDALPDGTVASLLEDPTGELAQILLYHVVAGEALSTDLSDGQMITTLEATDVMVSFSDGKVLINGAMVTVADIETDNGVVHVIDAVLIPEATTGINETVIDKANVSIYPNPVSEVMNVSFEVSKDSEVSLEMYNLQGQQVRIQQLGYTPMGFNSAEMGVGDLESGLYVVIINTGKTQIAKKVRVVK